MTNEFAINILEQYREKPMLINEIETVEEAVWLDEALATGIQALKQKSCEDTISRQTVNTLVDELARAISDERCCISRGRSTATIMQDILNLPPVKPQEPRNDINTFKEDVLDAISRIGLLKSGTKEVQAVAECLRAVEALSPVKPQERQTGHWIDNNNGTISCSHCHTWFNKDDRYFYMRYCPYCNEKMIENEE